MLERGVASFRITLALAHRAARAGQLIGAPTKCRALFAAVCWESLEEILASADLHEAPGEVDQLLRGLDQYLEQYGRLRLSEDELRTFGRPTWLLAVTLAEVLDRGLDDAKWDYHIADVANALMRLAGLSANEVVEWIRELREVEPHDLIGFLKRT